MYFFASAMIKRKCWNRGHDYDIVTDAHNVTFELGHYPSQYEVNEHLYNNWLYLFCLH